MPSLESELLLLLSDSSAYLGMNTEDHGIINSRKYAGVRNLFICTLDDLVQPTGVQDGCQHEAVCHSGVSATVGLGSCRTKLGVWTIGEVDVDK